MRLGTPDCTRKSGSRKKPMPADDQNLVTVASRRNDELPPILAGRFTPAVSERVRQFFFSVESMFEAWLARRNSPHTQRAYREDVMAFVRFLEIDWPASAPDLLRATVKDVHAFRALLYEKQSAPKTINRRISSLSSFYKYMAAAAAELRLPITIPNPAHAQFIARETSDAREETKALTATRARQLIGLPTEETVTGYRDRAILKFFLYTGARIGTACRLKVSDFHQDGEQATIRLHEKGDRTRTIGLHFQAAQGIAEYIQKAELTTGPLFRALASGRSKKLSPNAIDETSMYRLVQRYIRELPGSTREVTLPDGTVKTECVFTPHSLRATTATLLLDAGVDITKVQGLLGHRHITTTQIYDKRRRAVSESASHDVPI